MNVFWILFKQNRFLNFLIMLVAILFFFLILILVVNLDQANIESKTVSNFEGKNIYQVTDNLVDDRETTFFSNSDGYDTLNNFNNKLSTTSKFISYTAHWQPINIANFNGGASFDPNYEYGGPKKPTFKLNDRVYSSVLSLQLNKPVFELNNIQLSKGRKFNEKEYIYNNNTNVIPVMLGNDYSSTYKLNDNVDILVYGKEFKGHVVGFFEPSQKIMASNNPEIILDKYIVLPALTFKTDISNYLPKDPNKQVFFRATLFARTNSLMLADSSPLEIRKDMDYISKSTGFEDFQVIGANSLAINAMVNMTKANLQLIYLAIVMLFLIIMCSFIYMLYLKIKKNISTYSVLLISGANMSYIKKYVKIEFLIINVIGVLVPLIPFALILHHSSSFLINYFFVSSIFLIVILILIKRVVDRIFNKVDIIQQLKG